MSKADLAVSDEGFITAVAPTVAALLDMAGAYHEMQNRHGLVPAAESPAMGDLAAEERFCRNGWQEPVGTAHSLSGPRCFAGIDHITNYAKLFASPSPPVPVYSHLAVARAALEAFAWGRWLADTTVDVEGRVKRGVVYRLNGNRSRGRIPELKTQAAEIPPAAQGRPPQRLGSDHLQRQACLVRRGPASVPEGGHRPGA